LSRNEAENKVWEVDSHIIARESDRRGTAARDSYERENSFVGKKNFFYVVKMEDLVRGWEKRQTQSNNKKAATYDKN
jgi:hypothetical protein